MITESERSRMLAVPLCGLRVVKRLESIGVTKLSDLRGRDAQDLMHEINIEAGRRMWGPPMGKIPVGDFIDAAQRQQEPRGNKRGRRNVRNYAAAQRTVRARGRDPRPLSP